MRILLRYSNLGFEGPVLCSIECSGDGTPGAIEFNDFDGSVFPPGKDLPVWKFEYEQCRRKAPGLLNSPVDRFPLDPHRPWTRQALESLVEFRRFGNWIKAELYEDNGRLWTPSGESAGAAKRPADAQ